MRSLNPQNSILNALILWASCTNKIMRSLYKYVLVPLFWRSVSIIASVSRTIDPRHPLQKNLGRIIFWRRESRRSCRENSDPVKDEIRSGPIVNVIKLSLDSWTVWPNWAIFESSWLQILLQSTPNILQLSRLL